MPDEKKPAKAPVKGGLPTYDTPGATFPGGTGAPAAAADTPHSRISQACAGKPSKSLVEVAAADVVAVADLIPEDKRSKVATALRAGAARALAEKPSAEDPAAEDPAAEELRVYQYAGQLGELLEAGGP